MRRILFSTILLLCLLLQPLVTHAAWCEESSPITIETLLGTWVSLDDPYKVTVQYRADGTFSGQIEDGGVITWRYKGTWGLTGRVVHSEYTYSSLNRIPAGTKDTDEILSIACGVLTYRSQYGNTKRYLRIGA